MSWVHLKRILGDQEVQLAYAISNRTPTLPQDRASGKSTTVLPFDCASLMHRCDVFGHERDTMGDSNARQGTEIAHYAFGRRMPRVMV
jgi:hypothetical protein